VAHWITQAASLPAQAGPLGPDGAVYRPGTDVRSPVDGAAVGEVVESSDAVGGTGLISGRIAEESGWPSQGLVLGQDGAADLVTAGRERGVRRAVRRQRWTHSNGHQLRRALRTGRVVGHGGREARRSRWSGGAAADGAA